MRRHTFKLAPNSLINETGFKSPPLPLDGRHALGLQGDRTPPTVLKVAHHVFLIGPHGAAADGALKQISIHVRLTPLNMKYF